jgi:hypothetical protein
MPKYALIRNIGGLVYYFILMHHLLHFRRFSGHFVELTMVELYYLYISLILISACVCWCYVLR